MTKVLVPALLLIISLNVSAALTDRLLPSQLTRPGANPARLNAQIIDLTLSDVIYLGLRDNRAIRSTYLDRVAQKFDLLVAAFRARMLLPSRAMEPQSTSSPHPESEVIY